ncbi:MAG: hypothetical protein Q4G03_11495 [Planctomycetia bacterium]|nr:hypothetical protein [Planctomycetia bacterium]
MTAVNRWVENGVARKNSLLRAKLTLTSKSSVSGANAVVGDYYLFNCKTKSMPAFSKAPTWHDVTDNPSEPSGYAYAGKPEQLDVIELTTRTPIQLVYEDLIEHQKSGDVFSLEYIYDDPHETSVYTVALPNCQIIDVAPTAGANDAGSQTRIRILPEGGSAENMPSVTVATRA